MLTLVDRKSRFVRIDLVVKQTKDAVAEIVISLLADNTVHIITCANGKKFAEQKKVAIA